MTTEKENELLGQLRTDLNAVQVKVTKCETDAAAYASTITATLEAIKELQPGTMKKSDGALTKGRPLKSYLEDKNYFSGTASEISRSLALGGIALIWLFKKPNQEIVAIDTKAMWPLFLFVFSLGLDLLQYVYGATGYDIFYSTRFKKWDNLSQPDEEVKDIRSPNAIIWPLRILFYVKIGVMFTAYVLLFGFLLDKLISLP